MIFVDGAYFGWSRESFLIDAKHPFRYTKPSRVTCFLYAAFQLKFQIQDIQIILEKLFWNCSKPCFLYATSQIWTDTELKLLEEKLF